MTLRLSISCLLVLFTTYTVGQSRTLAGKVIGVQFSPIFQAKVFSSDTLLLAESDKSGNFNAVISADIKSLLVTSIGMELKKIDLAVDCNNLDIILQPNGSYDFMSAKKVDRKRKKEFAKLPQLHRIALEKGIFKSPNPCYRDNFISRRKRLEETRKGQIAMPST